MALFSSSSITTTPTAIIPSADIANLRLNYQPAAQALIESTVSSSPFTQFNEWFASAKRTVVAPHEPNAMHLSTASIERDEEGRVVRVVPSGRIVLLKGVEEPFIKVAADGKNEDPSHDGREGGGFIFYTNYRSKKARDLDGNPAAALTFYWATNEYTRSIRIQGHVQRVSEEESTAYFHSRPPASQIGAWASPHQSAEVKGGRDELESNAKEIENRFKAGGIGKDSCGEGQNGKSTLFIPKPDFWGGYRVVPDTFEFWEGRPSRLHDRIEYYKETNLGPWKIRRLSP